MCLHVGTTHTNAHTHWTHTQWTHILMQLHVQSLFHELLLNNCTVSELCKGFLSKKCWERIAVLPHWLESLRHAWIDSESIIYAPRHTHKHTHTHTHTRVAQISIVMVARLVHFILDLLNLSPESQSNYLDAIVYLLQDNIFALSRAFVYFRKKQCSMILVAMLLYSLIQYIMVQYSTTVKCNIVNLSWH